ncbi:MAG: aldo/keto reductase [Clostridia bacterium]|nr:aldo/keto reductase [Clostridia bacterium]
MEKRTYARTGEAVSLLGYGTMRMPKITPDKDDIDYEAGLALIDYAYKHGVNYFDTAYMYHGGKSELFVGEALSRYPRDSFFLADKMPGWMVGDGGVPRAKEIFEDQLAKCRTSYFDFYLLHSLNNRESFEKGYLKDGVLDYLDSEKAAGRIHNLGFSFHGDVNFFAYMMELRKWDFCQIQCNYLDWDSQDAKTLYRLAEEHGVQLIIMEPVRGGALVNLCEESVSILKAAEPDKSVASWAIRFVASLPNVLCVLSGMSNMEQVVDNVSTITDFKPLNDADYVTLNSAITAYIKKGAIPCTGCRYCFECPKGIEIPEIFAIYNQAASDGMLPVSVGITAEELQSRASAFLAEYDKIPADKQAHNCIRCGKCTEHCPQTIKVPDKLREIAGMVARIR